jgi:hypothetical protein
MIPFRARLVPRAYAAWAAHERCMHGKGTAKSILKVSILVMIAAIA